MATLKELRQQSVLSQRDLASAAGVSANTINRIETGKQKPNFKTIRKLAKALNINPSDIEFTM